MKEARNIESRPVTAVAPRGRGGQAAQRPRHASPPHPSRRRAVAGRAVHQAKAICSLYIINTKPPGRRPLHGQSQPASQPYQSSGLPVGAARPGTRHRRLLLSQAAVTAAWCRAVPSCRAGLDQYINTYWAILILGFAQILAIPIHPFIQYRIAQYGMRPY